MRKNIFWMLLVGLIAASCDNAKKDNDAALNDKKQELVKLKEDEKTISKKIADLEAEIEKLDTNAAKDANAKLVSIAPLSTQRFIHYIELQGKIEADNSSFVSPRMGPGLVKEVYVKEGQQVRKGQLLLKLDDAVVRQQVAAARSGLGTIQVQLATAKDVYNRRQNLWKQGIGAELQVIEARTAVAALESQLATAKQNIGVVQEQMNATNIYSDVNGVAEIVNIRPGETFTGFVGNMPQIAIVNRSSLKASVQVPENYAGKVKAGSPVIVKIPDINKEFSNTTISRSGATIDPGTRTFTAEAKIPNDPLIRP
ncbi:MAG: efflux RND transporter periplasmic adaptor subunit, partial [Flavisolibacter sp.]